MNNPSNQVALFVNVNPHIDLWSMQIRFGVRKPDENIKHILQKFIGDDNQEVNVLGMQPWIQNLFIAQKWREKRIFLVGDAAHSWPPYGGIGGIIQIMNN